MDTTLSTIKRPQRWDVPFWQDSSGSTVCLEMNQATVERLLLLPPFDRIDPQKFPPSTPYPAVLLNDTRIRQFRRGDIIVRQGDYGHSAFFIISGTVQVVLDSLDDRLIGRRVPERKGFWTALAQLWSNPAHAEVRQLAESARTEAPVVRPPRLEGEAGIFLQDSPAILQGHRAATLGPGEFFGEIAALARTQRTSTVVAGETTELLEIRWQGLREIRLRSPELKEHIDRLYRERSLTTHLRESPLFRRLSESNLARVAAATEFQTYGNFEWYGAYQRMSEMSPAERLEFEPVVARQGHYPNGVFLIRAGFARLSETYNHSERTVSYLGRGQVFGFDEIVHNWRHEDQIPFQRTLRALGYVDVLFVPTALVEQLALPSMEEESFQTAFIPRIRPPKAAIKRPEALHRIGSDMLEFLVEKRFINGTATMIIDLDRCTRCDDCVRACAATHQNNPRFVRQGATQSGFMIAQACMHCLDPVCMIGCPTGAIHRQSASGQVVINDRTCIGCGTCANSCPYENILMVVARDAQGIPFYDATTRTPIYKAAKCDLCVDQITGPACANACPHDALVRIDMRDLEALSQWFYK